MDKDQKKQLEPNDTLEKLPPTIEKLQLALVEKKIDNINVPIKKHHNIPLVLETLRQHFSYHTVPEYIFDFIDLPKPSFDIFESQKITNTTLKT